MDLIGQLHVEEVFLRGGNGLASGRGAIWDVYLSEPGETAVKVAVLPADGTFQILVLPGVEVGRAELPPLLDVVDR